MNLDSLMVRVAKWEEGEVWYLLPGIPLLLFWGPQQTAKRTDWMIIRGWPYSPIHFTQCPWHAGEKGTFPPPPPETQQQLCADTQRPFTRHPLQLLLLEKNPLLVDKALHSGCDGASTKHYAGK